MTEGERVALTGGYIGARIPRREDARLLTGRGTFVDDLEMPGVAHAAMVRSPHAHARVRRIDTEAARALPGVLAVVTAADLADIQKPWPARMPSPVPGTSVRHGARHTLPKDKVRHAGEVVAAVVAESRAVAEDARDLVVVEYEPLPVVASAAAALAPGAPLVYEELGDNVAAHIVQRVGQPERAFADADHVLRETFRVMRGGSHSMEGRGAVARYDEALDALTVWDATQAPHAIRAMLAYLFDLPDHRVRVIAPPDVGGGLGPKASFYPEEALVCWLARHLRRPVKWVEDRLEHFVSAAQEREQVHTVEIAFTREGRLLGLRDTFTHDIGMYGALVAPVITACTVPGPYRIPNIHSELWAAYTNLQPTAAVRGAGRPQGVLVMERMMDRMAETLGLDPAEARARNLIPADAFPYPVGMWFRDGAPLTYDSGDYPELLRRALALADYEAARREQAALRAQGRHRGIGIAICVEGVGLGPFEGAILRLDRRGQVVVTSGAPPRGRATRPRSPRSPPTRWACASRTWTWSRATPAPSPTASAASRAASPPTPARPSSRRAARSARRSLPWPATCWKPLRPTSRSSTARCGCGACRTAACRWRRWRASATRAWRSAWSCPAGQGGAGGLGLLHAVTGRLLGELPRLHPGRGPGHRGGGDRPVRGRPRLRQRDQPAHRGGPDPRRRRPRPLQRALRGGVLRRGGAEPGRRASSTTRCPRRARCRAWRCST